MHIRLRFLGDGGSSQINTKFLIFASLFFFFIIIITIVMMYHHCKTIPFCFHLLSHLVNTVKVSSPSERKRVGEGGRMNDAGPWEGR